MARLKQPQIPREESGNDTPDILENNRVVTENNNELPAQNNNAAYDVKSKPDDNIKPDEGIRPDKNIKPDENTHHDEYLKAEIQELKEELESEKIKETRRKKLIRVLLYLVIISVGIFAVLFLISKAALYDSIGSMLRHMWGELQLMGERIFR